MWGGLVVGLLARPWVRRAAGFDLATLTIALFVMNLHRAGERAGRAVERLDMLERSNDIQRQMLEAAAARPRSRDDLVERLRGGQF